MQEELYKRMRPNSLNSMIGSYSAVNMLKTIVLNNSIPHAILLSGNSGTGKTTAARILRRDLKCADLDFREMNSASYRGIDTIRDIQQQMYNLPMAGDTTVYLFDEAEKLSSDAQAAMKKMLEDTPNHVFFMLATEFPQKIAIALRTRCKEINFQLLNEKEANELIQRACKAEKVKISQKDADAVIDASGGSPRKILVNLESVLGLEEKDREEAVKLAALVETQSIDLCRLLMQARVSWSSITSNLKGLKADPESVRRHVLAYAQSVLLNGDAERAYQIISSFREPLYDIGMPGLVASCYEVVHGN